MSQSSGDGEDESAGEVGGGGIAAERNQSVGEFLCGGGRLVVGHDGEDRVVGEHL